MKPRNCALICMFLVFLVSQNTFAFLQAPSSSKRMSPLQQKDVDGLLDRLGGVPAEYKADLGFRILRSDGQSFSPSRRMELLSQIFIAAPSAKYRTFLIYAAQSPSSSASQSAHNLTVETLDQLTIQTAVVDMSLQKMPDFAAEKFVQIVPKYKRSSCDDPSVADTSAYYTTLAAIMADPSIAKLEGTDKRFYLQKLVDQAKEIQLLAPLLGKLSEIAINDADRPQIVASLLRNFDNGQASDREMSALYPTLSSGMSSFIASLERSNESTGPLLESYRKFLTRSLVDTACADKTSDRPDIAKSFNGLLVVAHQSSMIRMNAADLDPKSKGNVASDPEIPFDPSLAPYLQRLSLHKHERMIAASKGEPLDEFPTDSADVDVILKTAISSTPHAELCHLCDYESRAFEFFMLANSLPSGPFLQRALATEMDFLSFNRMEEEDPPAYLLVLKQLINVSRPVSEQTRRDLDKVYKMTRTFQGAPSESPEELRKLLHQSNDPIIRSYMLYEDIFHPTYQLPASLAERLAKSPN